MEQVNKMMGRAKEATKEIFGGQPHEGRITKAIEQQTAKIPSVGFLTLAVGAMALSLGFELATRRKDPGTFVGLWAPTLLLFGIYNKLVKLEHQAGIEQVHQHAA